MFRNSKGTIIGAMHSEGLQGVRLTKNLVELVHIFLHQAPATIPSERLGEVFGGHGPLGVLQLQLNTSNTVIIKPRHAVSSSMHEDQNTHTSKTHAIVLARMIAFVMTCYINITCLVCYRLVHQDECNTPKKDFAPLWRNYVIKQGASRRHLIKHGLQGQSDAGRRLCLFAGGDAVDSLRHCHTRRRDSLATWCKCTHEGSCCRGATRLLECWLPHPQRLTGSRAAIDDGKYHS